MSKDAPLYGIPRPKTKPIIASSNSATFASSLQSLLSTTSSSQPTAGRPRPSKSKNDIFTAHNRNSKKRAIKDLESDDNNGVSQKRSNVEAVDDATLHRSKRKMEEKARLYAAMKRGDYVGKEENALIDFDRKWAEGQARGEGEGGSETSSGDDEDSGEEMVEYTDEFGRQRTGTRAEAAREERRKRTRAQAADEEDRFSARPKAPDKIIFGDTIQTSAFNPDEPVLEKMEQLAERRDRTPTPPRDEHYDATKEVRTKGVGFYAFSQDEEGRMREMEGLKRQRMETEKGRKEREERARRKREEVEERRRIIREKRGMARAEKFLTGLGDILAEKGGNIKDEGRTPRDSGDPDDQNG